MQVNFSNVRCNQAFMGAYATTSTKNNGDYVEKEVIDPFQQNLLPAIKKREGYDDFSSIRDNVNAFCLQAGSGTRFKQLANTQGEEVNKVSFALPMLDGITHFHIPDVGMSIIAPFSNDNGISRINAEVPLGSFAEVVTTAQSLRQKGEPQKDVVVCCGDNLFHTEKPFELNYFIKDTIENDDKVMGIIGVVMPPEDLINKFGAVRVAPTDKDNIMSVLAIEEKPKTTQRASLYAMPDGNCVASVGMFVIKAKAMDFLLDNIKKFEAFYPKNPEHGFIARGEKEPYDFSSAIRRVLEEYGSDKCDVRLTKTWEDAGEPAAFYKTIEELQEGKFLTNFDEDKQELIKESAKAIYDPKGKTLLASFNALANYGSAEMFSENPVIKEGITVTNVEGVNIVV